MAEIIEESYCMTAPKRLVAQWERETLARHDLARPRRAGSG